MTTVVEIPCTRIMPGQRLREIDPAWVEILSVSIANLGLLEPILVRPHFAATEKSQLYMLVAGAHRLEAAMLAGLEAVPCHVSDMGADEARLAEIDENLMRQELNALDRAVFLAERKEVYERLNPVNTYGGDRKSRDAKSQTLRVDRFTRDAAEKCGLSERTIQDAVALAKALPPEVRAAVQGTALAKNAAQLKALAKQPPADRLEILQIMKDRGCEKVAEAARALHRPTETPVQLAPEEIWQRKMQALWATAQAEGWKDRFLAAVGAQRRTGKAETK
ncbi:ParB/RepB/Spo0J family partition protein [Rhodobacter capsulatus]|uniref:Chromosome partitioning protein, ParB family n=1 Tax=Rhodobacter capsulatus TaxID=1061 RepID=A0A1G7IF45_RHOCA|nr:ParB N-terminal domain-containing protein [Rhodobacter capsulatus]SDF10919.1 chromosome partitioning protein, ParB family [Rhodobacter capsulatus]